MKGDIDDGETAFCTALKPGKTEDLESGNLGCRSNVFWISRQEKVVQLYVAGSDVGDGVQICPYPQEKRGQQGTSISRDHTLKVQPAPKQQCKAGMNPVYSSTVRVQWPLEIIQ